MARRPVVGETLELTSASGALRLVCWNVIGTIRVPVRLNSDRTETNGIFGLVQAMLNAWSKLEINRSVMAVKT